MRNLEATKLLGPNYCAVHEICLMNSRNTKFSDLKNNLDTSQSVKSVNIENGKFLQEFLLKYIGIVVEQSRNLSLTKPGNSHFPRNE